MNPNEVILVTNNDTPKDEQTLKFYSRNSDEKYIDSNSSSAR
jgi:hypothetical protein